MRGDVAAATLVRDNWHAVFTDGGHFRALQPPWTEEPTGPDTCYLARMCRADGGSGYGFTWPDRGYVESPDWDGDLPKETQRRDYVEWVQAWKYDGTGLWGFRDGARAFHLQCWAVPLLHMGYSRLQILTVKSDELREGCSIFDEYRVPRAWVKYSGSITDVCDALLHDADDYSLGVRSNILKGVAAVEQIR